MNWYLELFGYAGTALVLLSMMMTSIRKLRILNITGSVINVVYSAMIGAWPVCLLNAGMILINAVQIVRLQKSKKPPIDGGKSHFRA